MTRMASTALGGAPVHTVGDLPSPGDHLPSVDLVGPDLAPLDTGAAGKRVVLNIFPSVDTGVCAASVRRFNELAAARDDTVVVCASQDLPFAQARFCGSEGLDQVLVGSGFRTGFGDTFGVRMTDGKMAGLLARAVVVADADGTVRHVELVEEIGTEPDYAAAIAALD